MTRVTTTARLLTCRVTVLLSTGCHHTLRPSIVIRHSCLQRSSFTHPSYVAVRPFSSIPPPPPSQATSPSSAAPRNESLLAETGRLVSSSSPSPAPSPDATVLYMSPFVSAVRRMKLFSLSSCALSLVSAPLLLLLSSPSIPLSGRLAMCTAVASFGIGTTLALTKFTQPYVIRIHSATPTTLLFETLNIWARPRYRAVPVGGLRPLYNRLLSNVRALHDPPSEVVYSDYFLHADMVDHPLLKPLVEHSLPPPEEQPESQQQAEATSGEQTTAEQQPAAGTVPKQSQ